MAKKEIARSWRDLTNFPLVPLQNPNRSAFERLGPMSHSHSIEILFNEPESFSDDARCMPNCLSLMKTIQSLRKLPTSCENELVKCPRTTMHLHSWLCIPNPKGSNQPLHDTWIHSVEL